MRPITQEIPSGVRIAIRNPTTPRIAGTKTAIRSITSLPIRIPVRVTTRILFARATTSRRVEVRKEKERRVGNTES
ncbi:unnamed protein product [Amoebophrya sp. A120]|nr:unnamed protein product [Amoebophrya sp. A120]|eukprot:GSA120T00016558001.1